MPRKDISDDAAKGGIAKSNKQAMEELKSLAKALGMSESEAFQEAVELFRQAKLMEGLDPKCFLAGYSFAMQMLRQNLMVLLGLNKVVTSEMLMQQYELLSQLDQAREALRQQIEEALKEQLQQPQQQRPSVPPEVRQMMLQTMLQTLLKMFGNTSGPLSNVLGALAQAGTAQQSGTAGLSGVKIEE